MMRKPVILFRKPQGKAIRKNQHALFNLEMTVVLLGSYITERAVQDAEETLVLEADNIVSATEKDGDGSILFTEVLSTADSKELPFGVLVGPVDEQEYDQELKDGMMNVRVVATDDASFLMELFFVVKRGETLLKRNEIITFEDAEAASTHLLPVDPVKDIGDRDYSFICALRNDFRRKGTSMRSFHFPTRNPTC